MGASCSPFFGNQKFSGCCFKARSIPAREEDCPLSRSNFEISFGICRIEAKQFEQEGLEPVRAYFFRCRSQHVL